ncbi:PAS domain-containing protein [Porphyrobacter sp. GA68]|uniref:PAS domain-containing protein n=1 Tax=Porphyrobacter sp. GA68 TaxID=2883480 RepID=UPI001D18D4D9|nr:PAS domain-containing protein [Porphyrobacter sp. GA68]
METQQDEAVDAIAGRHALLDSDIPFRSLANALPHMVWSTLPDGYHDYYNDQWYAFTGVPVGSTDGEEWNNMFHPDDQARAWERWRRSLATGEPYEVEYRLRHRSGEYRWTLGRAYPVRGADGQIVRWIGTCTDIHDAKDQAARNEILSRELSHRIKNIFAVIGGLIGMSTREAEPDHKAFAKKLQQRIAALSRAHEFVRPHSEESAPQAPTDSLHGILLEILSPYPALAEGRITLAGPDVRVDDRGATPLALLVHELATNAVKYGALSSEDGQVAIVISEDGDKVRLEWRETGGPTLTGTPSRQGFGTRLCDLSIVQQLGGTLERNWLPEGLAVNVAVERDRLVR